jgi:pimeloyl-ACP methyl ester carboxylesterase
MVAACQQETQTDTQAPALPALVTDSVLSADSVLVRYDVRGSGERALVFIHCWCCDRTYWAAQVEEFAEDYRVVTLDLAGHGESGAERAAWTMAAYGADVAAVVNKLALPEVILIGHSMGGTVMIEAARRLGERVIALIGVDNLQNLERELTEEQINGYLALFSADFPAATHDLVMGMFPETADSALAERISSHMASAPETIALGSFDELFHYDYTSGLSDVRLPIRCINSDTYPIDTVANKRVAASFAVKIMPGMGHFPQMVEPETFNQLLHETIEEFWPREVGR